MHVALLTGGDDRSYAYGLTRSLVDCGVRVDVIGSDDLDGPEMHGHPSIRFLNLRGSQRTDASALAKAKRLSRYYARLLVHARRAEPRVFHVLWNNRIEWFDRTLLMAWYRLCGRRVLLTAHNVNAARRDGRDSALNRATLRLQYRLCDHLFVHTARMRQELCADFGVLPARVSVIPFGLNDTSPRTALTRAEARRRLALDVDCRTALFFGQIAPYKGLEYLLGAVPAVARRFPDFRLLVAGKVKRGAEDYWARIETLLAAPAVNSRVQAFPGHVPDADVEVYFKAADVLVLPYTAIFQSGVPFLAYSFGVPVVATDVGALAEDVIEGRSGHVCRPRDADDLARALCTYFDGDLYRKRDEMRERIAAWARTRYSWSTVARTTVAAYAAALQPH